MSTATRSALREGVRLRPWPMVGLAVVVMVLTAAGVIPRWPGAAHLVALPPLDLLTDLRLLITYAPSYPIFFVGLAASLAIRTVVLALLLGGLTRARLLFALRFYLLALPFTFFAAFLFWSSPATIFYALFWFGLILAGLILLVFGPLPWMGTTWLLGNVVELAKQWSRAGTLVAYAALLLLLGGLADAGGAIVTVLLVPVSAALALGTAHVLLARDPLRLPRRALAGVLAAVIAAFVAIVATGPEETPEDVPDTPPLAGSLFIMGGLDSASGRGIIFSMPPAWLGYTCEQTYYYSYAGPGEGQPQNDALCPIRTGAPYGSADTMRSLFELAEGLRQQVQGLPEPVVIAGHSQAVWIIWEALTAGGRRAGRRSAHPHRALPESPAPFPPEGEREPGLIGADLLHIGAAYFRDVSATAGDPAAPFARELLSNPEAVRDLMARPLPEGVEALSIPSVFDLHLKPMGWELEQAENACPLLVLHPNLPWSERALDVAAAFLHGEPLPPCPWWRPAIGSLMRPFSVPPAS